MDRLTRVSLVPSGNYTDAVAHSEAYRDAEPDRGGLAPRLRR